MKEYIVQVEDKVAVDPEGNVCMKSKIVCELVRCKDCKWFVPDGDGWGTCVEDASKWEEDGYCSWGEREGEEE